MALVVSVKWVLTFKVLNEQDKLKGFLCFHIFIVFLCFLAYFCQPLIGRRKIKTLQTIRI
jgi:hypothetical protein